MLAKLFTALISPLGAALLLGLLALVLGLGPWRPRLRRLWAWAGVLAVGWRWLWSLPVASDALRVALEGQFAYQPVTDLPAADAAVVLGGGINGAPPGWPYPDLGSTTDRVWRAARLFHAGKAKGQRPKAKGQRPKAKGQRR